MSKASAKNNPKQLDAKREKRARQAQRRAEREHPNAAAIAPVRAQLDEVLERKSRHVLGHGDMAKSLELMEKMRDEGASDHEIDAALAEAKLPSVVQVGRKSLMRWPSWWWLNRRERALRAKIDRLMEG
ncbi:cobalamin ABC transporter ATPase [Rothia sp. (in: high G+C Gram-positive bacteria)]|uniref:cobalamin ABC transporter ATPase n=1 Tax=Rothia sp. (in: high G+C Gram-positive bacteria) TaxID=1885016 RepID=UPI0025E579BF|nr:cobalamin ABC transporter ATPase [Rothia sp. (in: high G+C Gram-positive bacteria)]